MDIEHFGFLSSVIRKTESHEQDGETLLREPGARSTTASGHPAMALLSSSVSAVIRSERIATCTSGEPVSLLVVAYDLMISALRPVASDIVNDLVVCRRCPSGRRG